MNLKATSLLSPPSPFPLPDFQFLLMHQSFFQSLSLCVLIFAYIDIALLQGYIADCPMLIAAIIDGLASVLMKSHISVVAFFDADQCSLSSKCSKI